jgi:hypothetical protein
MSWTRAEADELSELLSVDIAAENTAPSTRPSTPTGEWCTMKSRKTSSPFSNAFAGA